MCFSMVNCHGVQIDNLEHKSKVRYKENIWGIENGIFLYGYQFEDYVEKLLIQLGFRVTNSGYSRDGEIDLIAEYDKPIFKGKYIIQCKNWSNNVGQPEIRDLYGVTMSENANKGMLITTSDFSEQARKFAINKNIQLINGKELRDIVVQMDYEWVCYGIVEK